jgi:DNA-directed RNA polymerase subunit M/transcription elongation factor TFIIS
MDDYELDSYEGDEAYEEYITCPECGSADTTWIGGDSVVNLSPAMPVMTRFDIYACDKCGHKWTE